MRPEPSHAGPPRTLDEAALRAQLRAILGKRYRSAQDSAQIKRIRASLQAIEHRSPWRQA